MSATGLAIGEEALLSKYTVKPLQMCEGSSMQRYSTRLLGWSAGCPQSVVGVAAAAAPARRADQLLLSSVAPGGVFEEKTSVKSHTVNHRASGVTLQNKCFSRGKHK